MKLTILKDQLKEQPPSLLRRAGYTYIHDRKSGQDSFVRRLGRNFYPRFHCRIFEQANQITLTLHLDQRPTRYEGAPAHAAENDTAVVQREVERLQEIVDKGQMVDDKTEEKHRKKSGWWPF